MDQAAGLDELFVLSL